MSEPDINHLITQEKKRQKKVINLIASENYVSRDVLRALGSELTNKYAEGYPGKRYYGGQRYIDQIEELTQTRALKVFRLSANKWAANVQPLSGTPANLAVYLGLLGAGGDKKIMGLDLSEGGHLSHGFSVSATGQFWQSASYGVDPKTGRLDYERISKLVRKEKPNLIVAGFTAYSRKINWQKFRQIADQVGAYLHADISHIAGLIAGGAHPSPFGYVDTVVTTTHKTLRGPRGAIIYAKQDDRKLPEKINKAVFPGLQGGPHQNQIAATAVALEEALRPEFKRYAKQVVANAKALSAELKSLGWPIITGGTDTHLFLVDTWQGGQGLSGKAASDKLEAEGIIVNKNTIPGETRKPANPSGIRLGTPAETTRGKVEVDMKTIARKIDKILRA